MPQKFSFHDLAHQPDGHVRRTEFGAFWISRGREMQLGNRRSKVVEPNKVIFRLALNTATGGLEDQPEHGTGRWRLMRQRSHRAGGCTIRSGSRRRSLSADWAASNQPLASENQGPWMHNGPMGWCTCQPRAAVTAMPVPSLGSRAAHR